MLASLLLATAAAPLGTQGEVDHASLVTAQSVSAAMLAPERERWAVARVRAVGPARPRETVQSGGSVPTTVFDVDLDVLDGWNVARGPLRAFWWEGVRGDRRRTVSATTGERVLVRLAPVEDGHFLLVSGTDEEPYAVPSYAASGDAPLVSILLPYDADRLEPGPPKARRWASLWRAGSCLSASALSDFGSYVSFAPFPLTPVWRGEVRRDETGRGVEDGRPGLADVQWLLKLAQTASPDFRLLVAESLFRRNILGSSQMRRDLVLLSLKRPELFPNGLFLVMDGQGLSEDLPIRNRDWLPTGGVVKALTTSPSLPLMRDLFTLLTPRYAPFVPERAKLLPLLNSPSDGVRTLARMAFDRWQGKPPSGADPYAWHAARARLGEAELAAAGKAGR